VHGEIEEMIAQTRNSMNLIIQSKREVADISRLEKEVIVRIKVFCLGGVKKISKVLGQSDSGPESRFIPLKRAIKCIGVNQNTDCRDDEEK